MTMRTVRFKERKIALSRLRSHLSRKRRTRVESAINSKWTLREVPEAVKALESERCCLRAELVVMSVLTDDVLPTTALRIIRHLQRIDSITQKLNR